MESEDFTASSFTITLQLYSINGFPYLSAFVLRPESNNWLFLSFSVTPSVI